MSLVRCKNGHMFSSRRYGETCPYCNMDAGNRKNPYSSLIEDPDKTMPLFGADERIDPVAGWLVCVEGVQRGKDYKIRSGKNFIGRADNMNIQILGDNSISRVNHAAIVYDKKDRVFHLLPGDSTGLVYKNEEAVYAPVELKPYDMVEIGLSKFLFASFCGEHFEWGNNKE